MDDILIQVLNYVFDHGIGIYIVKLKTWTRSKSDSDASAIVLNSNWHNPKELVFQAGHEIGHLVNGDRGVLYYATKPARQAAEGVANRTALKIIVPIYFSGSDPEDANVRDFMDDLAIPCWLEGEAPKIIHQYFSGAFVK